MSLSGVESLIPKAPSKEADAQLSVPV